MALDYLQGGENITAERWNLAFAECNRKAALALDGKSFFVAAISNISTYLVGKVFCFGNGARPYTSNRPVYNHATYTALASAAVEVSRDDDFGIMSVTGFTNELHGSLEAHTREGYYLRGGSEPFPEKIYKYAVAELVYEGIGFGSVLFPRHYNKYNFFRIHNLNYYPMRFSFETATGHQTYTIAALGCLCVRRDSVDSGYASQWAYLWPAESGDPRFFVSMATRNAYPIASMSANNVSNPACIHLWAGSFHSASVGIGGGKWFFDPHVYHDVSSYYCPTYFPSPSDTTKPAGDFFHHKGVLDIAGTRRTFNGYATITADIPELGITSLSADEITVNPAQQITAITTNLLNAWNESTPILEAESTTLENTNTGRTNLVLIATENQEVEIPGDLTYTRETIIHEGGSQALEDLAFGVNFSFHRDTLADVLKLNTWGNEDYNDTDQNTNAATISDRNLRLTPLGPRITFTQTFSFDGAFGFDPTSILTDMYAEPTSTGITRKGYVQFDGYGWPIPTAGDDGLIGSLRYSNPAHLSPRTPRAYSHYRQADGASQHPNITNPVNGVDGADFDVSSIGDNYQVTEYAFMAGVALGGEADIFDAFFRTWENPDGLVFGQMPRVPLLREHYNAMAQILNSVRRIKPMDFTNIRIVIPSEDSEVADTIEGMPVVNFTGINGSVYCPKEMYCSFAKDSTTHKFFQRLGVPILTVEDLPQDFQGIRTQSANTMAQDLEFTDEITASPTPPAWDHSGTRTLTGVSIHFLQSGALTINGVGAFDEFYWVSIEDVQGAVEALGWKFFYQHGFSLHAITVQLFSYATPYGLSPLSKTFTGLTYGFPDHPQRYPVGTKDITHATHEFQDRIAIFIDSEDGEWKQFQNNPGATDASAAGYFPSFLIQDSRLEADYVFMATSIPDSVMLALGNHHDEFENRRKYALFQNYYTASGMTDGSVAFLVPVTWARHTDLATYVPSKEALLAGPAPYPLEAEARGGSTTTTALPTGDLVISFQEDKSIEVVPMVKTYIDAEA